MSELLENPERLALARSAIQEYEHYSPEKNPHDIPELLDAWLLNCEDVKGLAPEEMRQVAWLHAERAMAATMLGAPGAESDDMDAFRAFVTQHLRAAEKIMGGAYIHKDADPLLKKIIDYESGAMHLIRGYTTGNKDAFIAARVAQPTLQRRLVEEVAAAYAEDGGIDMYTLGHALTVSLMIMDRSSAIIPVPTSPRMRRYGIDTEHRSDLILLGHDTVLLAVTGLPDQRHHVTVPYDALRVNRPKSKHTNGLSVGLTLAQEGAAVHDASAFGQRPKKPIKLDASLVELGDALVDSIETQIRAKRDKADPVEAVIDNPLDWYAGVSALRHPYVIDAERLEEGLSLVEMDMAESDLGHEAAIHAGWMYIESGIGRAMQPTGNRLSPSGDFDRAEDMFVHAYEKSPENATVEHYELLLAHAAVPMYRAIALHENPPFEDYAQQLAALAENLRQFSLAVDKSSSEFQRIDALLKIVTTSLLCATDPAQSVVVVPSSLRQREMWHMAVWHKTKEGFTPQKAGRLVLADANDIEYYSLGAAAVTPKMLGQRAKNTYMHTLYHLVDHVNGVDDDGAEMTERIKAIARARQEVLVSVKATTN
jgi:hypothetical protein